MTILCQLTTRLKNFLIVWLLVLGLKESMVKSEVILTPIKQVRKVGNLRKHEFSNMKESFEKELLYEFVKQQYELTFCTTNKSNAYLLSIRFSAL